MAYSLSPIQILVATSATPYIEVFDNNGVLLHSIIKANIQTVTYTFTANPGSVYGFPTMTILHINMINENGTFQCELQNVTNQATWNTGARAAAIQAVNDINASL